MKSGYKILKVLNNNSLLISDGQSESIIIGKGIGFKRKPDEELEENVLIEKEFHAITDNDYEVSSQMPKTIIQHTASIVDIVDDHVASEISEKSFRSLTNHVAAMLVRLENNEVFPNPFHHETVTLYGDSYNVAIEVASEVEKSIGVSLPEAEIDFLTLYIHSIIESEDKQNTRLRNAIISEVSETLESELDITLDKSSIFYARFITHLKFLIERLTREEEMTSLSLANKIANEYPEYMEMSKIIVDIIEKHLNKTLTLDEHMYLALHLARLTIKDELKGN